MKCLYKGVDAKQRLGSQKGQQAEKSLDRKKFAKALWQFPFLADTNIYKLRTEMSESPVCALSYLPNLFAYNISVHPPVFNGTHPTDPHIDPFG